MRNTYGDAFLEKHLGFDGRYPWYYGFKDTIKETIESYGDSDKLFGFDDITDPSAVDDPLVTVGAFSGTKAKEVAAHSYTLQSTIREAGNNIAGFLKDGDLNGIFDINAYSLEGIDTIREVLADKTNPKLHHEYNITEDYFSGDTWSRTVNWYLMKRYSVMYDPVTKSFVPMFSMPTKLFSGVKKVYTVDGQEVEIDLSKTVTPTWSNIMNLFGGEGSIPPFKHSNRLGHTIINKGDKTVDNAAIILKAGDVIDLSKLPQELRVRYENIPMVFTTDTTHKFTFDGRPFGLSADTKVDSVEGSYYDGQICVIRVDWSETDINFVPAMVAAHEFGHAITDIGDKAINVKNLTVSIENRVPEGPARTAFAEAVAAALGTPNDVKNT